MTMKKTLYISIHASARILDLCLCQICLVLCKVNGQRFVQKSACTDSIKPNEKYGLLTVVNEALPTKCAL